MKREEQNQMNNISDAIALINTAKTIALCAHVKPDGDAIGSTLALGETLTNMGKVCDCLSFDDIPEYLSFLPLLDHFTSEARESYDLFIALDTSDIHRLGVGAKILENTPHSITIDHHVTNTGFAEVSLVDKYASSTCELIHRFIKALNAAPSKESATLLFNGITTDTGRFMYQSATKETFETAAELITLGADRQLINYHLYQSTPIRKITLWKEVLDRSQFFMDGKLVITSVTEKMVADNGAHMDDTEEMISDLRDIDGVEVAAMIKEYGPLEQKVSLRSKRVIDVSTFAKKFGGGGHVHAAGLTLTATPNEAAELMTHALKLLIQEG